MVNKTIFNNIKAKQPLVHCITNFVTVNDCANILLAAGGSPTMAYDVREMEEIAAISQGVVLNIGTADHTDAMILAGKVANKINTPVVLDPVAAGASKLRADICKAIIKEVQLSVIRGNISEIKAIAKGQKSNRGVDAQESDAVTESNINEVVAMAKGLSEETGAIIAISGVVDIVANKDKAYLIHNGCAEMAKITGSGCMLAALIGAYCGANLKENWLEATAMAVASMGLCGEKAKEKMIAQNAGTSTFRNLLIDEIYLLTAEKLQEGAKIEVS